MGLFDLLKKDKLVITRPVFQGCEKSYAKILSNDLHSELVEECMSKKVDDLIKNNFNTDLFSGSGVITTMQAGFPSDPSIGISIEINFTFSKNGSITNIKASGPNTVLENEAIRVLGLMPKFKPATISAKGFNETSNYDYGKTILFVKRDLLEDEGKNKQISKDINQSSSTLNSSDLNGKNSNKLINFLWLNIKSERGRRWVPLTWLMFFMVLLVAFDPFDSVDDFSESIEWLFGSLFGMVFCYVMASILKD